MPLETLLNIVKTIGNFFALGILPLVLIMLIKRVSWQHPLIQHFNRCIRNGTNFPERECHRVEIYLKQIENCFALLKGESLTPIQKAVPVNIAFRALPLLHKMAQKNTCCAVNADNIPPFSRIFVCKHRISETLHKWQKDKELPLVAKEIENINKVDIRIETSKSFYYTRIFLIVAGFIISSFFVTDIIIKNLPVWKYSLLAYFILLTLFAFSYDYYYSQRYRRYSVTWVTRLFKSTPFM